MVVRTRARVARGEQLTITYCSVLLGTRARHQRLLTTKGFTCSCSRCQDPGEAGTNMSGLVCTKCQKSVLLPHLSTPSLVWKCSCGFQANSDKVAAFLDRLEGELVQVEGMGVATEGQVSFVVGVYSPHAFAGEGKDSSSRGLDGEEEKAAPSPQ